MLNHFVGNSESVQIGRKPAPECVPAMPTRCALRAPSVHSSVDYERIRHAHACVTSVEFMIGPWSWERDEKLLGGRASVTV